MGKDANQMALEKKKKRKNDYLFPSEKKMFALDV